MSANTGQTRPEKKAPERNTPIPAALAPEPVQKKRKKKGGRLVLIIILLLTLAGGASAATLYYLKYQPFTNQMAQSDQSYSNNTLGFSLHYPLGWQATENSKNVLIADSTQTAQVNVVVSPAGNTTIEAFLAQQVTQQGITGVQTAAFANFGRVTWEAEQGSVVQSGVSYTIMLYAAKHGLNLYLVAFLAIQGTYASEDASIFVIIRNKFMFL
jgi:flagellar basal body-associated protein FliL